MNTIDSEQQRLQAHYQTYFRTITQSDSFVSCFIKLLSLDLKYIFFFI
jgi:hypothetical protein